MAWVFTLSKIIMMLETVLLLAKLAFPSLVKSSQSAAFFRGKVSILLSLRSAGFMGLKDNYCE
jgi:hypothetical protein